MLVEASKRESAGLLLNDFMVAHFWHVNVYEVNLPHAPIIGNE